ncbi:hypothetical protein GDO78_012036 [Eleutherodactylus coqui]|uniref:Uncharacterized protein n=1 Tax=Eleutherodactylus coqui TaxID=57060 RepID=A0A8J6F4C9_ELECQ|nr:hypothetical protein GDO78_012036 [Eleutherodactylus coqui]
MLSAFWGQLPERLSPRTERQKKSGWLDIYYISYSPGEEPNVSVVYLVHNDMSWVKLWCNNLAPVHQHEIRCLADIGSGQVLILLKVQLLLQDVLRPPPSPSPRMLRI